MSHAIKQTSRARALAFRAALSAGVPPFRMGQQELFTSEEEQYIQHEVNRKLYAPKLPNAGGQERKWMDLLRTFGKDEALVVNIRAMCWNYAQALEALLPAQEYIRRKRADGSEGWLTLPGCYYTRKGAINPKTTGDLFKALLELKDKGKTTKNRNLKWLAEFLMDGIPAPVSNFKMECLYLLRGADGNVTRLVRLVNTKGEMSEGREIGGADMLPNEMYAGSEKFRQWVASKGNFAWGGDAGAGNTELQQLQWDVTEEAAYRVVKLIEYCGFLEIKVAGAAPGRMVLVNGIWFYDGCAIRSTGGKWLLPDDDGIVWADGIGYALSSKGRELEFAHGRPYIPLDDQFKPDQAEWSEMSRSLPVLSGFFREVCARFHDTAGGPGGWMAVGSMLGYAAGPEFFKLYGCLPSLFTPGEMGSGKTFFMNWLMGLQGYGDTKGLGLGKGSFVTVPGLCAQLENYSCLAVWFDEYRQHEITDEKVAVIRAAYDRQMANKWTPDGVQRVIRTTPLVSGETSTSDAATHSRYAQLQLSRQERLGGNHLPWLRDNRPQFVRFWRHIMEHRTEYVELVMRQAELWFASKDTELMPERSRATYALSYAAFMAAVVLFQSHTREELDRFRSFLIARAMVSATDVDTDKFINVFLQDLMVAHAAGAIPNHLFRVTSRFVVDALGLPWKEHELYMEPHGCIDALQIHLRKANRTVALKYKDLRDNLSKNKKFWIEPKSAKNPVKQRFGPPGSKVTKPAWGIRLDHHPLGRQDVTLEDVREALDDRQKTLADLPGELVFRDGDPRRGPLYSIVEAVEKFEADSANP